MVHADVAEAHGESCVKTLPRQKLLVVPLNVSELGLSVGCQKWLIKQWSISLFSSEPLTHQWSYLLWVHWIFTTHASDVISRCSSNPGWKTFWWPFQAKFRHFLLQCCCAVGLCWNWPWCRPCCCVSCHLLYSPTALDADSSLAVDAVCVHARSVCISQRRRSGVKIWGFSLQLWEVDPKLLERCGGGGGGGSLLSRNCGNRSSGLTEG